MNSENIKNLINSFTEDDFKNCVNLHIHSTCSDGKCQFSDVIKQAKELNYKKISICDHNTIDGYLSNNDDILLTGVEFDCWYGYVFFHLLAYGIDVTSDELKPFLAKHKYETEWDIIRIFAKRDIKKLITAIHNAGGIAVLAHPACCWALSLERFVKKLISFGLDGIEIYYPYKRHRKIIKFHNETKIINIANKFNLIKTGGTDCHNASIS
ncbi:PHP domain-containing protein [bacterium]|nr:PHP domain-containing protein [bacterium]